LSVQQLFPLTAIASILYYPVFSEGNKTIALKNYYQATISYTIKKDNTKIDDLPFTFLNIRLEIFSRSN
jgi:hypothetical protein